MQKKSKKVDFLKLKMAIEKYKKQIRVSWSVNEGLCGCDCSEYAG